MQNYFTLLKNLPVITHISEHSDGSMKIGSEADQKNRITFLKARDIENIVAATQSHTGFCRLIVTPQSEIHKNIDAFVTRDQSIHLSVTTADCLPVYMYDPKTNCIGIAHAGWRGLLDNIIQSTLTTFVHEGSAIHDILVGIGPGIGPCHFEIQNDVYAQIPHNLKTTVARKNEAYYWDIKEAARTLLIEEGVVRENIEISPLCTYCETDLFFSYRREKPKNHNDAHVMMATIGIS